MFKKYNFSRKFWQLNFIQMVERLSYWVTLIQIPIYIAQKDIEGGLQLEQTSKGIIFFWWALVQNMSPVLLGGISDRIGRRKSLLISSVFIIIGYILLGTQKEYLSFLLGTLVLGFGLGTFKPAMQGWIASELDEHNSSTGWGTYVFLVNIAVFLGPPVALFLKAISWEAVFFGSAAIYSLNIIFLLMLKSNGIKTKQTKGYLKLLFTTIFTKRIGYFILIMSGFTMTYMQFYETLPNFIFDWSDTSAIAAHLPSFMVSETARGTMIAYEWIYNLNAGLLIMFVILAAKLTEHIKITHSITIGILLSGVGLFIAGYSQSGIILILGVVCYSFGEIINNPKFSEYIGRIAPNENKSLYMGIMNISWAIGLAGGGLIGGWLYKHFGEKATFAQKYLLNYGIDDATTTNAFDTAMQVTGMNNAELTTYLWNIYNPNLIWLPFLILSCLSVVAMYFYSKKY